MSDDGTTDNEDTANTEEEYVPILAVTISCTNPDGSTSVIEYAWKMPTEEPDPVRLGMVASAMSLKNNFIYLMNLAHGDDNSSYVEYDVSNEETEAIDEALQKVVDRQQQEISPLQAFMEAARNRT